MQYETALILTDEDAKKMVAAAEKEAKNKIKVPMAIAVVDAAGNLKAFLNMDGAVLVAGEIAILKAKTSAGWGFDTEGLRQFIASDEGLKQAQPNLPNTLPLGGGIPVRNGTTLIGAIGASGGHWTQDIQCAQAGVEALK